MYIYIICVVDIYIINCLYMFFCIILYSVFIYVYGMCMYCDRTMTDDRREKRNRVREGGEERWGGGVKGVLRSRWRVRRGGDSVEGRDV